jgi:putative methanogenesis marker protein 8
MDIPTIPGDQGLTVSEFLTKLERRLGNLPSDLHVSRMFSSLVAVSEGNVIGMSEPYMEYCPLAASLYGRRSLPESGDVVEGVCKAVGQKTRDFGYYTGCREVCTHRLAIPFGASEMMMRAARAGVIDAAVVVCEGAGTVIAPSAELIQGIGARMNGLFYTSPITETVTRITKAGGTVVFPETAAIDQLGGLEVARRSGFRELAVTVNGFQGEPLGRLRETASSLDAAVVILGVCTTGIDEERAEELADCADLVWACASDEVRRLCGAKARIQVTTKIPVFVMTDAGVRLLAAYAVEPESILNLDPDRQYLVSQTIEGTPVTLGKVATRIAPCGRLPVGSPDSPRLKVGDTVRRPTERNAAGAVESDDAAESR